MKRSFIGGKIPVALSIQKKYLILPSKRKIAWTGLWQMNVEEEI